MKCARTACQSTSNIVCRHTQTGALYCPRCMKRINEHNPGLIVLDEELLAEARRSKTWGWCELCNTAYPLEGNCLPIHGDCLGSGKIPSQLLANNNERIPNPIRDQKT